MLTKAHTIQDNAEKDLQYFLDMDMAVLGRSSEGLYYLVSIQLLFIYTSTVKHDYNEVTLITNTRIAK